MKIELYLISPFEEYAGKHVCRKHWNFQWRGRRGTQFTPNRSIRLRKENFGGLFQSPDGKLWKLDLSGYKFTKQFIDGISLEKICKNLNIKIKDAKRFIKELKKTYKLEICSHRGASIKGE